MAGEPINVEQLRKAKQLFEEATAVESSPKTEFDRDPQLATLVERMLEADDKWNALLDEPVSISVASQIFEELSPGSHVDAYEIVRKIGTGGMGDIYLAKARTGAGNVPLALKLLRWTSPELLRGFQREVAILSSIHHPNIAGLIDSGTTDKNTPYLVMEYVEGESIKSYCERQRLPVRERVTLFRQLCAAVRYLHQNLIVHRDLKPSNVLVASEGRVKLVDFGIAKLLESQEVPSLRATLRIMTPDYASPEQVKGLPTTTLTDVYSLGLLLFELLAGANPFTMANGEMHQTLREICEKDPPAPSTAVNRRLPPGNWKETSRQLRGELDNIVLKALRKQPEERYQSAEQLDDDLERYLHHKPVAAQGASVAYQVRKFATRHRAGVAFATALLVILLAGMLAISYEARLARRERARAESHAAAAERAEASWEEQSRIADEERRRAELQSAEAQRQRAIAERRLAELEKTAKDAAQLYSKSSSGRDFTDSELIAENAREALLTLKRERALDPGLTRLLGTMSTHPPPPDAWHVPSGWAAYETTQGEYLVRIDHGVVHGGNSSLLMRSQTAHPKGGVAVMQTFSADRYRGGRVRFAGYLRPDHITSQALLYITVKEGDQVISFDQAVVAGTADWTVKQIVVDLPRDAESILIGVQLLGSGALHADDLSFERVSGSVALTVTGVPINLGFGTPKAETKDK